MQKKIKLVLQLYCFSIV